MMKFHLAIKVFHIGQRQRGIAKLGSAAHQLMHGSGAVAGGVLALCVQRGKHRDGLSLQ